MKDVFKTLILILLPYITFGQLQSKKEINQQTQTWVSLNTFTKWNNDWGVIADVHERWNGFFKENNFYFLRGGISYSPNSKVALALGYAHMWLAPSNPDWSTYSDENRIYQQFHLSSNLGTVSILQRLRNEQRWQEKIVDDKVSGEKRFTNRIRYLASFNIPVFKNKSFPVLVVSDEIMVHFGKEVVFNTFEQNRLFIGIKQTINPKLSFDFGYMNVYQQKYSGYQYDMNHTLRLFFYLNNSFKQKESPAIHQNGDE